MRLATQYHKLFSNLMDAKIEAKSFVRRDKLRSLQARARDIWNRYQYFAVEPSQKPKFFMTFPYAYMNGLLHLGHAFSMTKCDFNAWYKRLCGFNVLFPFGFHCTGMPISAAAKKLTMQYQQYGNPPVFPVDEKGQKKKGQYHILQQMDVPKNQIQQFADPWKWVKYFPPIGRQHLKMFGTHIDQKRSFITTDLNPYYNSFIEWQFNILKQKEYISFGTRPSIYSPLDKQMCADHDRREGEGVNPEEYTLIKIRVIQQNERMKKSLEGRQVYLVAATLRPETMYGQTCCFLLPTGDYCAIEMKNKQVFICSERSALNMAYQELTRTSEQVQIIDKFKGDELMGLPICAPLALNQKIYTLPMLTISMNKGTGVVTCVPSDSPDDWMAISDLRAKKALCQKHKVTQQMASVPLIPIMNIPSIKTAEKEDENLSAVILCKEKKIKSQNDRKALDEAKDICYKKGFHEGVMIIGDYKGSKVLEAKNLVKKELIDKKFALTYYEPNGNVVSRSGDTCVVKYCEQWFINYANEKWKSKVIAHVQKQFKTNSETLHNDLIYTINWLHEWGCSRSFGLGTKLPFDNKYLIESLSDSTIYMAYYTIAHYLQGNLDGSQVGQLGIRSSDLTLDFWDYVFLGKEYKSGKVPQYKLKKLRDSFLYWYPMDLRCSGKDLIKNHLTMSLFNHAAIWQDQPDKWPRKFYCNGFILVEGQKMSKSKGNFITLEQVIEMYGADAARLACAQAGDSIDDANFTKQIANAAILQLSTLEMYLVKVLEESKGYRKPEQNNESTNYFDMIFESEVQDQISKVKQAYEQMIYRDAVKYGFHDFVGIKDAYLLNCGKHKPRIDLIERYIYIQLLFLYPICPHFCEVSYIDYFISLVQNTKKYPSLIGQCKFPERQKQVNYGAIRSHQYIIKFSSSARQSLKKVSKPKKGQQVPVFKKATVIYRQKFQPYQLQVIKLLQGCVVNGEIKPDWRSEVKIENKEEKTKALKFGAFMADQHKHFGDQALKDQLPFNELQTLYKFTAVLENDLNVKIEFVEVNKAPAKEGKNWAQTLNNVKPGDPTIVFE